MATTPTRAELLQHVEDLRQARDQALAYQPSDKEAAAIARCVKALEPIAEKKATGSTYWSEPKTSDVRRVLHYLAQRHGFTLYDQAQPEVVVTETVCRLCRCQVQEEGA